MDKQVASAIGEEHPSIYRSGISRLFNQIRLRVPAFVLALGEALLLSWWLLLLIDLLRPGMVSTIWNLNWLILAALILFLLGLLLGAKTGRINSLVALISAILIMFVTWQWLADTMVIFLAPICGLIVFVLFKYQNHD